MNGIVVFSVPNAQIDLDIESPLSPTTPTQLWPLSVVIAVKPLEYAKNKDRHDVWRSLAVSSNASGGHSSME